jgi:ribosome biogenesis GTPase
MFDASAREDYPAVGDWVAVRYADEDSAIIESILPRKNILRKTGDGDRRSQVVAANIDSLFIVEAVDRDFSLNRYERYLVLARDADIKPIVVLNKTDLVPPAELDGLVNRTRDRLGADIITTSVIAEDGLAQLLGRVEKGKTYSFVGSSGVGKSSLINRLLGDERISTSEISLSTGRGKHTTTRRNLYFLENGGIVIDNPGIREVGVAERPAGLETAFDEISVLAAKCRFADCTHTHEPGCAVIKAVEEKELDKQRYENYIKMKKEADFRAMTLLEKRNKDRKFGKYVKKALEQKKKT